MKKVIYRLLRVMLNTGLIFPLIAAGCSRDIPHNYQSYSFQNYVFNFTFEYPSDFEIVFETFRRDSGTFDSVRPEINSLNISIIGRNLAEKTRKPSITVRATNYQVPPLDISNRIETYITNAQWQATTIFFENVNIDQRYITTIDDITCEILIFTSTVLIERHGDNITPYDQISCDVCFNHEGFEWDISFNYPSILADQMKNDLEHILQTFRILD